MYRRPRDEYISTILKPNTWGGAIELSVLAKHYCTEIASIDVETGRIDHFTPPPDRDTGNRCILVYSGIHYDAATLAPMVDAPDDFHQTVMPIQSQSEESDGVLGAAKKLADKLRAKRAYTNTATFDLKCQVSDDHSLIMRAEWLYGEILNWVCFPTGLRPGFEGGEGSPSTCLADWTC